MISTLNMMNKVKHGFVPSKEGALSMNVSVFVRPLRTEEQEGLSRLLARAPSARVWRRAQAISLSAQAKQVPLIAESVGWCTKTIRTLIRKFNRDGLSALHDRPRSGRKKNSLIAFTSGSVLLWALLLAALACTHRVGPWSC